MLLKSTKKEQRLITRTRRDIENILYDNGEAVPVDMVCDIELRLYWLVGQIKASQVREREGR